MGCVAARAPDDGRRRWWPKPFFAGRTCLIAGRVAQLVIPFSRRLLLLFVLCASVCVLFVSEA